MNTSKDLCPQDIRESLQRYIERGIMPGGFLTAVLENNLLQAITRADNENLKLLPNIVSYCWNEIPSTCWGSPERVDKWLDDLEKKREQP